MLGKIVSQSTHSENKKLPSANSCHGCVYFLDHVRCYFRQSQIRLGKCNDKLKQIEILLVTRKSGCTCAHAFKNDPGVLSLEQVH